ncbi:unnamed protein product [Polarella glacialis]|uniref:DUF3494 domain-containing protein n=1 Tax=Polarella glacialis TaxID=89957 RepID=A0A813GL55_POLGL|nr:unnamed protein product [Polarella glacialis]
MQMAYDDAASRPSATEEKLNRGAGILGGETLGPGLYTFSSSVEISSELKIEGISTDTWIFQVAGNLNMAANKQVTLVGGALASNIVWQVAGNVAVESGACMEGILLVKTAATFKSGSSLNGRILAQTAVTLDSSTVTQPPPQRRILAQTADILV